MAREYIEHDVPQPRVVKTVLVDVTCDRCGQPARCMGFTVNGAWLEAERHIQGCGGDSPQQYDLCHDCSVEFDSWVKAGK